MKKEILTELKAGRRKSLIVVFSGVGKGIMFVVTFFEISARLNCIGDSIISMSKMLFSTIDGLTNL